MPEYTQSLARLLNFSTNVVNRYCVERLEEYELTLPQWVILTALWRTDGLLINDLAQYTKNNPPAVSRIVDRMVSNRTVRRKNDKMDGRSVRVHLTKSGRSLEHLVGFYKEVNDMLLTGFNKSEVTQLFKLMQRLHDNVKRADPSLQSNNDRLAKPNLSLRMNHVLAIATVVLMSQIISHAASAAHFPLTPDKHDLVASLDRRILELFDEPDKFAMVVGAYKDGRSYINVSGITGASNSQPANGNTVFQIGSITKVFTASLLQEMVDQGVVSMDASLGKLLADSIELSDVAAKITLRQLASHTSGLPRVPKSLLAKMLFRSRVFDFMRDPYSHLTTDDVFHYLASGGSINSPGKFEYSNYGMGLLGHVLEKVTGETLEQLYKTHLFEPMDMSGTSSLLSAANEQLLALGHKANGKPTAPWRFNALAGAGAINASANDMLAFIEASLENGRDANRRLMKMRQPQFEGESGLGWVQPGSSEKDLGLGQFVWHNGMTAGFASYIALNPDEKIGIVVLTNRAIDLANAGRKLARVLISQSWPE